MLTDEQAKALWIAISQEQLSSFLPVKVKLLETNHCINLWQNRARVRKHEEDRNLFKLLATLRSGKY